MTQEKYPSGRVVNMGYDAVGRLSNLNSGAGHTYVDAITYAGHGGVTGLTLGNGATISLGYGTNGRLQVSDITLAKNGTTLQKYEYKYGVVESGSVNTAKNTGQLAQVESWIGTEQQYRQQHQYDVLGRVTESKETSLGSTAYDVKYRYDVFGNREQRSSDNSGNSAIVQKWVESGDISKTNNRYTSGVTYDAAGNITADPRFRNLLYGYDANGRQNYTALANSSSPSTAIFDGAGQRIAEKASGALSIMVYDAGGKLAAEYAQISPPATGKIEYVTNNYQGSTSVVTDRGGAVTNRHDYLPFGEEIGASVGSRTTGKLFSQTDSVRQKYAGMETDTATGMAHTLWRKQDSWSGRWTSPDPYGGSMTTANPQSFDRYTYCSNDPINHVDPSGLYLADIGVYQTENPGVAATLEREISRRVGVLTSPGGIAYQKEQKANEAKNRKDAAEAKNAQGEKSHAGSPSRGAAGQEGGPQESASSGSNNSDYAEGETTPSTNGLPPTESGGESSTEGGPGSKWPPPDSVIGTPVPNTFGPGYNCAGFAFSVYKWLDKPANLTLNEWVLSLGATPISCRQSCAQGFAKIKTYDDTGDSSRWHMSRKIFGGNSWAAKYGPTEVRTNIPNPDKAYRGYYPPRGSVIMACYCAPARNFVISQPQ